MVRDLVRNDGKLPQVRKASAQGLLQGVALGVICALVSSSVYTDTVMVVLTAACGLLLYVAMWGRPRFSFVVWLLSMATVPIWINVELTVTVPLHCIVALMAITANISRVELAITKYDMYFAAFLAVALAAVLLGGPSVTPWTLILVRWGIPYFAVRVLVSATGTRFAVNAIAAVLGSVGWLAVLELMLAWHPFVGWDLGGLEYETWHVIQVRHGGDRSEWAFGHSLALGGALAISIPFVARSSFSVLLRIVLLAGAGGGILATGSRGALVAAAFTAAICVLYLAKRTIVRVAAFALVLPAVMFVAPRVLPILETWARGTSDEEQGSFAHRGLLYSSYLPRIEWFGTSAENLSIDSQVMYIGLGFGWVVLVLAVIPVAISSIRLVSGRASTAEIAIVGQIPLFATVALITQYESIVFLVAGIAVQMVINAGKNQEIGDVAHSTTERSLPHAGARPT